MLMLKNVNGFASYVVAVMLIGFAYGGVMGVIPPTIADCFGAKHLTFNFAVLFSAYETSAFVGPRLAAVIRESHYGDYSQAFFIAGLLAFVGIAVSAAALWWRRHRVAAHAALVTALESTRS
jgi:OFA family oxalate/formate antiporter-like MFS transporter